MDLDLNVLCVQVLPVHLDPRGTMEKVGRMIAKYSEADLVVLPEMAFSGYTFNDFEEIIMTEDAKKRTYEWMMCGSLNMLSGMTNRTTTDLKNEITPLDFGTVQRFGGGDGDIKKHSVTSFEYLGRKIMFKEWGELNKSNSIGNGKVPDRGYLLAMDGLYNDKGESIPPIQFFNVPGWEELIENDRNQFLLAGCEELRGDIIKTIFWLINCPDRHYIFNPQYC